MRLLTIDADLRCTHLQGRVDLANSQLWVTIAERAVLVRPDPVKRPIKGCPMGAGTKPCTVTLAVASGYSSFVSIDGKPVCLDTVVGSTDGTALPALYAVASPGQSFVDGSA
jgi:hypothetical protein